MTSISKNMCIDKLDDLVDKYNDTYSTIKVKPVGIKSKMYIDFIKENNEKDPKFKISDIVRMSKYLKKIAGYTPNWSEEAFIIKKVKKLCHRLTFLFNWDSLHGRLNSHFGAWSYKKKMHKKIKAYRKSD